MSSLPVDGLPLISEDGFDAVLESCRLFLSEIATDELPSQLAAKGGASDIVQETLAAAVQNRGQFRGATVVELRAWLHGILQNELALFRRRYSATRGREVSRERSLGSLSAKLLASADSPIAKLVRDERERAVAAALADLDDEQREAILLRLEERVGFREIGERLGRSEEAARKLFTRSLDRLRGLLADSPGDR